MFGNLPYPSTKCSGKIALITGGNTGLGLEAARHFVRLNAEKVIIGCRSIQKGNAAKVDIEKTTGRSGIVEVWEVDLTSFSSVKLFSQRANGLRRLDYVIESAGVLCSDFKLFEGHEETIKVNVLSTFLMALFLLPVLRRTASESSEMPHLTIVSSDGHAETKLPERNAPSIFEALKTKANWNERYQVSKLLEILITRELAEVLSQSPKPQVLLNAVNPSLCKTELFRNVNWPLNWIIPVTSSLFGRTPEMGSRTLMAAAFASKETHGGYMSDCKVHPGSAFVRSEEGEAAQKKAYKELMSILEEIEPGISSNI